MLKYVDTAVTFAEVPDEISLCINISNCPCHCNGCHSPYLAEDIGEVLTGQELLRLINKNNGISCVCFMGGDSAPSQINALASVVKLYTPHKVAWYSGRDTVSKAVDLGLFDYIKVGHYDKECGPLNVKGTNQRFYSIKHPEGVDMCRIGDTQSNKRNLLIDETDRFLKKQMS